jgi:hypothetical protein
MASFWSKFGTPSTLHAINAGISNYFIERASHQLKLHKNRAVQLDKYNMLLHILLPLKNALEGLER